MKSSDKTDRATLAALLVRARATGQALAAQDLAIPGDIDAAFDVQAEVAMLLGGAIAGWKVGLGPGSEPVAAPLTPLVDVEPGTAEFSWHHRLGIEVELAVRLSEDIGVPPARSWHRSELLSKIDSVRLGVELTGSRLVEASAAPFTLFLADSLGNAGYVLGPPLPFDIVDGVASGAVSLALSGATSWSGRAAHAQGDPLAPLLAFANSRSSRLCSLRTGQIVTTGALCGELRVPRPGRVDIHFHGHHVMGLKFS